MRSPMGDLGILKPEQDLDSYLPTSPNPPSLLLGTPFTEDFQSFLPGPESILTTPSAWPHPTSWVAPARTAQGPSVPSSGTLLCFPGLGVQPHQPQEDFSACPCLPGSASTLLGQRPLVSTQLFSESLQCHQSNVVPMWSVQVDTF